MSGAKVLRVFITGGASGLGRALAELYAKNGARVCIADLNDGRGAETLRVLGADARYLHCDVTRESDLQTAADWLEQNWGGVDILYNNAGVAVAGGIDELSLADWQWSLDINVLGVVRGCKVFVPMMRRQRSGHIVNIASMAGLIHPPMMAAYNAGKAAVVAISETLNAELARDGIRVSVVCPAFFRTNLAETLRAANTDMEHMTRKLVNKARLGADEIAGRVVAGVARGDFHILTHRRERRIWLLKRFAPYRLYAKLMLKNTRGMLRRSGDGAAAR